MNFIAFCAVIGFQIMAMSGSSEKVADKIKSSFEKVEVEKAGADVSLLEDEKLDLAGAPVASTPLDKEQLPYPIPTFHGNPFPPPPKLSDIGGVRFKTSGGSTLYNDFNMGVYAKPEGNTTHVYEVSHLQIPRIPQFSGDDPPQKGDVTYREWKYEVQCLFNDPQIKETSIVQSIRRSLRGTAKQMLIPLGERATVEDILTKLDILFGEVSDNGMIMQEFFNAFQLPSECATSFGCRLESMIQSAIDGGYLDKSAKNDLLRHKFWTSLSSEKLKSQTRHKYDSIRNYDKLLLEIRRVEKEISINRVTADKVSKTQKLHQHGIAAVDTDAEERINKKIQTLQTELEGKIEDKFNQILRKLEPLSKEPRQKYHKDRKFGGKHDSKGEYDKRRDQKGQSDKQNFRRGNKEQKDPNY